VNEKPQVSLHATRRSASSSILRLAQAERRLQALAKRAPADDAREFYNRQARTDAAVRTIPGLHDFGK
jgi:hypothetical protein